MASTCPRPPQKGLHRSGLAATARGGETRGQKEWEKKIKREVDNGEEQEIEGTCNKREQKEARHLSEWSRQRENRRKGTKEKDVMAENKYKKREIGKEGEAGSTT